jgi:hypothetical protein
MEVCRDHGTVIRQCRCPGPKTKHALACPGLPECPGPPSMRVRAVMKDDAIFVHLRDLIGYVAFPGHDVNMECQEMIASLLTRLGEALESD